MKDKFFMFYASNYQKREHMTFTDLLNEHKNTIKCSTHELAVASELSQSVISRYLSGKRTPASGSAQLRQLCHGLSKQAKYNNFSFGYH